SSLELRSPVHWGAVGVPRPRCRAQQNQPGRFPRDSREELFEIADKPCTNQVEVQQQRNRLDTRKWALSKLAPRKYGDRLEHDHKGGLDFRPAILIQVSGGEREDDAKLIEGD